MFDFLTEQKTSLWQIIKFNKGIKNMTDFEKNKQDNETNSPTDKTPSQQGEKIDGQGAKSNSEFADKVGSAVQGDTEAAKDIYNQAKDSAGKVYGIATEKAASKIDEQKTNLAQGLSSVADTIRGLGDNLGGAEQPNGIADAAAKYSSTVADKVEQFSGYLDKKDLRELMRDTEEFAHRNPLLFLGGAFALGVLAARFLKSSSPNRALLRHPRNTRKDIYSANESDGVHLPEDLDEQIKFNSDGVHLPENLDELVKSKSNQADLTADTPNNNLSVSAGK